MKTFYSILQKSWPFLFGLVLGLYFITLNITGKSFTHFPGDLGDARFNTYILEHAHEFITGQKKSLWNAPFMYPEKDVITYSDNLIGSTPFYSFFRLIGYDRETSFQWWFLMMTVLSYTCCYLFLNWCFKNRYAAVLGAMVFAFSMALQSQMAHAQTFPRFAIPLAFWMGILFLQKLKPVYFFATLFFVVYQFYCCIYLGFMLTVPVTLLLLLSLIYNWKMFFEKIKNLKWIGLMMGSIVINILMLLPLMLPYLHRSKLAGLNYYGNIINNIPTIKSHLYSQFGSICWKCFEATGKDYPLWWDHQIFAGGIATLSLLIAGFIIITKLIRKKYFSQITINGSLTILFFAGLFTFLFFLRFNHFSLYRYLFNNIPGFASMRALQRIINVELIFFASATAFLFMIIFQKTKKISVYIFVLFAGIIIADNYYKWGVPGNTEKCMSQTRVNILIEKMKNIPQGSVVSYEPEKIESSTIEYQIDAMLASQTLKLNAINGYTGTCPDGYAVYWQEMNKRGREDWFKTKEFTPDTVYVVH